jgi:hypothetical protein
MIIKPHRVNKGAFEGFRTKLHEVVPGLRNLSHEDLESIKDERNTDVFDSS